MEFEFTPGILDQILNVIQGAIDTALPVLEGDVRFVFQSFLIISIVFAGAAYAFGSLSAGVEFMIKKILLVTGALFLVTNWLDVTNVIVNSFANLGLRAGGTGEGIAPLTTGQFFSPSNLLSIGWGLGDILFQRASEAGGFTGISIAAIFLFFSALVVSLAFLIIALQVFITLLEFKLVTLGGFILIPFALLDRTESLAQGALGYVVAAGVKIFTLAVVISFAFAIFPNIPIPEDELTFTTQFVIMGTALTFVLLALKAPSLASSMISGGPSLGVGALAQSAAAVAGAGAVSYAGIRASGAVGSAAGSVIHKARQGLQSRSGGGGASFVATAASVVGGGGSSGSTGTAVALRPNTAVRSPGTAVGPAFGGGAPSGSRGGGGGPSFDSGGGSSPGGFSSFDRGGGAAAPLGSEGDGRSPGTAGGSTSIADLKAARQSLKRGAIATGAALHGGGGGGGTARIDISSRR